MQPILHRLRDRKVVQWGMAYLAGAWLLLQVLELLTDVFGWPATSLRISTVVLGVGLVAALVLAWYHGERGQQKVASIELLMLAALLVIAGAGIAFVAGGIGSRAAVAENAGPAGGGGAPAPDRIAIAVLPFTNLSEIEENEYFSDGITDDILTQLSRIRRLRVTSRTSVMQYKDSPSSVRDIARDLGVSYVLEGSVRRVEEDVRVNAQLIDARTDEHLWAETYDRRLEDVLELQSEIARHIAGALKAELSPEEEGLIASAPSVDPEAYDLYLRAQEYRHRPGTERSDVDAAISLYRQAALRDPTFARAYAGLSLAYHRHPTRSLEVRRDSSLAFASQAVRLDSTASAAYTALGNAYALAGDPSRAELELQRALSINASDADAMGALSRLIAHYRLAEALHWAEAAVAADPTAGALHNELAWLNLRAGDLDRAAAEFRRHLELVPDAPGSRGNLSVVYFLRGDEAAAERELRNLLRLAPGRVHTFRTAAMVELRRGNYAEALRYLEQHAAASPGETLHAAMAYCAAKLGDEDAAEAHLRAAEEQARERQSEGTRRPLLDAELHVLRGRSADAIRILRDEIARGWRDYWLSAFEAATGFRLSSSILLELDGEPEFDSLMAEMRAELDRFRQR